MGIWNFDAFASDDAYELLGQLDDLLAARRDWTGVRAALRMVGLPCVGFNRNNTPAGGSREPVVSMDGAREALEWLSERADAAIREVRPGGEPRPELEGVAALGAMATLLGVAGPGLPVDPERRERWALWLETGPAIWTDDPQRLAARRQVARALREGTAITHHGIGGDPYQIQAPQLSVTTGVKTPRLVE